MNHDLVDKTNTLRLRWLRETYGIMASETSLAGLSPITLKLRFPGQFYYAWSGMMYNYQQVDSIGFKRDAQSDPIRLNGGINTFGCVDINPLSSIHSYGLQKGGQVPLLPMPIQSQLSNIPPSLITQTCWPQLEPHGHMAERVGTLSGIAIAGCHQSVPNAFETLLDLHRQESFFVVRWDQHDA